MENFEGETYSGDHRCASQVLASTEGWKEPQGQAADVYKGQEIKVINSGNISDAGGFSLDTQRQTLLSS